MLMIKLRVEVTAIVAADNLGQRGQFIIIRSGTEGCPCNCGGGQNPLIGTAGCGCHGPNDSQH